VGPSGGGEKRVLRRLAVVGHSLLLIGYSFVVTEIKRWLWNETPSEAGED